MSLPAALVEALREATGHSGVPRLRGPVSGGDIHRAMRVDFGGERWFVKHNRADRRPLFEAERAALERLNQSGALRVPSVLTCGADGSSSWLVLEYLDLRRAGDASALGRGLAALHRVTGSAHGWMEDNFIGHTPQANGWCDSWTEFWWRRRLRPQFERAIRGGAASLRDGSERLRLALPQLLGDHAPAPSLLHGDLWSGNHAYLPGGEPVLFDPASYFGDRETDLAMTELFGGFDPEFRRAYEAAWPLPDGYRLRRDLYQLYHVINHLNLFGAGWLPRVEALLARLLTQ